ncbi:methyltransferase family protein [Candidatus Electronema sp. PJ]|uniref:methyltransferase family protein n=1 Tax=Candidatus Electronema sp. PJ TaxID=3401572 RepID=UPI003AA9C53B
MPHSVLLLLWLCWCICHSLLISTPVNDWLQRQSGFVRGAHRLAYSLFSVLTLLPLLWYQYHLPQEVVFSWSGWLRIPQVALLLYALIMLIGGIQVYDLSYLVGIRQWRSWQQGKENPALPFSCKGVLRYVRHPWYSAGLPILWTVGPITDANLPARVILSLYLVIGTFLEERKLLHELGEIYRRYCQQVPMLIPWKGKVDLV